MTAALINAPNSLSEARLAVLNRQRKILGMPRNIESQNVEENIRSPLELLISFEALHS